MEKAGAGVLPETAWEMSDLRHVGLAGGAVLTDLPGPRWALVLSGAVVLETAAGTEPLTGGDAVLVAARTAHRIIAEEPSELVVADLRPVGSARRPPSPLVVRDFTTHHAGVAALVGKCRLGNGRERPLFTASYGGLIGAVMTDCWLRESEGSPDPVVASVMAAVAARPGEPWTVERMARLAHLSRSALGERFRRVLGRSPVEVLREVRMGEARRLLGDASRSVEHVAFAVGYGSAAAFSRAFSAHHGVAPQAWRVASPTRDPQRGEERTRGDGGHRAEQERGRDAVRVQEHAS